MRGSEFFACGWTMRLLLQATENTVFGVREITLEIERKRALGQSVIGT